MADNIKVFPQDQAGSVDVATDVVGTTHYPVYKLALGKDGAATLVTTDGLPIQFSDIGKAQHDEQMQVLEKLVKEMKIMNLHLSMMTDNEITKAELD